MNPDTDSYYRKSLTPEQRAAFDAQARARSRRYAFWYFLGAIAFILFAAYHNH